MNDLNFLFDFFYSFFSMPLVVPFVASLAFLGVSMLVYKTIRGF